MRPTSSDALATYRSQFIAAIRGSVLNIAAGMLEPTTGTIEVCGGVPGSGPDQLAKVGYVAQNTPVYSGLSIEEHLRLGAHLNPGWDA